ncbi:MAG: hypothetical protein WAN79_03050, partial [Opitutaceae bacterium]
YLQWFHNATPVAGATRPVLDEAGPGGALSGRYFLAASNREGTALTAETVVELQGATDRR